MDDRHVEVSFFCFVFFVFFGDYPWAENPVESEWPSRFQCCARRTDGHGFKPWASTNACGDVCKYVDQQGLAAMLTSKQSVVVTLEMNLRITQVRKHAKGIHSGFEMQMSPEAQNKRISGPTEITSNRIVKGYEDHLNPHISSNSVLIWCANIVKRIVIKCFPFKLNEIYLLSFIFLYFEVVLRDIHLTSWLEWF